MKYWIHLLIIILIGFALGQWFPWWNIAILAIISAYILRTKPWLAAMFGFLAGFILWAGLSAYLDVENQQLLSRKVGELLGGLSGISLLIITGFLGGLVASLGSFLGSSFRLTFKGLSDE